MTEAEVLEQIERIQTEVYICGIAYYQWKELHNVCSSWPNRPRTLDAHGLFWSATLASLQNTYILGLAKLFDKPKASFSLDTVIRHCKNNSQYFSNTARASRKVLAGQSQANATAYTQNGFEPDQKDFDSLKMSLNNARTIVVNKIRPIRHNVVAHTQRGMSASISASLYGKVTTAEIESVIDEANNIGTLLWGNWVNGHDFNGSHAFLKPPSLHADTVDLIGKASV